MTLIIHWLGPPLFLPWCSEATLAIWNERLIEGPYQKNISPAVRLKLSILLYQLTELSWPPQRAKLYIKVLILNNEYYGQLLYYFKR